MCFCIDKAKKNQIRFVSLAVLGVGLSFWKIGLCQCDRVQYIVLERIAAPALINFDSLRARIERQSPVRRYNRSHIYYDRAYQQSALYFIRPRQTLERILSCSSAVRIMIDCTHVAIDCNSSSLSHFTFTLDRTVPALERISAVITNRPEAAKF